MRCLRLAYPLSWFVLSGALTVLGPANGHSAAAAEYGPKAPSYATDPGSDWYYSGYGYDYGDDYGYGYDEYNYDTKGYDYDYEDEYYGYGRDDESDESAYGEPQEATAEVATEQANDEMSYSGMDQEAQIVDREGYWNEYSDALDDDLPLPPGPKELADTQEHDERPFPPGPEELTETNDETVETAELETADELEQHQAVSPDDDEYHDYGYNGYDYDGYYYNEYNYGTEHDKYSRDYDDQADDDSDYDAHGTEYDAYDRSDDKADYGYDDYGYDEYGYDDYDYGNYNDDGYDDEYDYDYGNGEYNATAEAQDDEQSKVDDDQYNDEYDYYDDYGYDDYGYGDKYGYEYGNEEYHATVEAQDEEQSKVDDDQYNDEYDYYGYDDYGYDDEYGYEYGNEEYHATVEAQDDEQSKVDDDQYNDEYDYDDDYGYDGYDYGGYGYEYGNEEYHATVEAQDDEQSKVDDYGYDYDYCEYGYENDYQGEYGYFAEKSYDGAAAMDHLDPFTSLPRDLLQTADKDFLRTLNGLFEESGDVREAVLNEYFEGLGLDAVEFVARFEEAFGSSSLMLHDDLPGVAALLATYRMIEQGELGMDEGVEALQRQFNRLSPEWIDDVSLIVTEPPKRTVRSDRTPRDGAVLQAVFSASARSIGSVGLGLSSTLGHLAPLPGRLSLTSPALDWTVLGTAAVRDWIAR